MTLNELIRWADENGMDFDAPICIGDSMTGTDDLTPAMIDLSGQDGQHGEIYIERDGNYDG